MPYSGLQIEVITAQETGRLLRRDVKKYWGVVAGLYGAGFTRNISLSDAKLMRVAYFFARYLDDALDGDHQDYPNGLEDPNELPVDVKDIDKSPHKIALLGRYTRDRLREHSHDGDDSDHDLQRLIDAMVSDYHRTRTRNLLSSAALSAYYDDTFRGMNIACIGLRSPLRQDEDFSRLANALGQIYSARDIGDDWPKGIYNVPDELLSEIDEEAMTTGTTPDLQNVLESKVYHIWLASCLKSSSLNLQKIRDSIERYKEKDAGARIVDVFAKRALHHSVVVLSRL